MGGIEGGWGSICLSKNDLDIAVKDKAHRSLPKDFQVILQYRVLEGIAPHVSRSVQERQEEIKAQAEDYIRPSTLMSLDCRLSTVEGRQSSLRASILSTVEPGDEEAEEGATEGVEGEDEAEVPNEVDGLGAGLGQLGLDVDTAAEVPTSWFDYLSWTASPDMPEDTVEAAEELGEPGEPEIREDAREQKDPGMAVDASGGGEGNAGAAEAEAEGGGGREAGPPEESSEAQQLERAETEETTVTEDSRGSVTGTGITTAIFGKYWEDQTLPPPP